MRFSTPLVEGKILKRYKRFLVDVQLDGGELVTAHNANTGSMASCWEPQRRVLLSYHDNPKRKLKYSLEMIHSGRSWICVNTHLANTIAREGILEGTISELQGYGELRSEIKVDDNVRLDFVLHDGMISNDPLRFQNPCYVEVKNVTLLDSLDQFPLALFPDSVSLRGQKHLGHLTQMAQNNIRAVMLYIVNRQEPKAFAPAAEIDSRYAQLLRDAQRAGVEILAYQSRLTRRSIKLQKKIPLHWEEKK